MAPVKRLARLFLVLLVLAAPFVLLRNDTARGWLLGLMDFMRDAGPAGVALFLVAECVGAVFLMPIWLMAGIAGYVYGFPGGALAAVPGVAGAGSVAFVVGRFLLARPLASASFTEGRTWKAIQRATGREGLKIAFLLRIVPVIPQNLLHYLMSTTRVSLGQFFVGTMFGLLPVTVLQVYLGSLVKSAAALIAGEARLPGTMRWLAPAAGVLVTIGGIIVAIRIARRSLDEALAAEGPAEITEKEPAAPLP
jgi:uncharacterized membrane protein YdjX (TVP38/TMEM64 family)